MNLFVSNIRLAKDIALRELGSKYKRSLIGWGWLVLTPLCLLGIYSLVFGHIFGIEWSTPMPDSGEGKVGFVLPFFVGLAAYLAITDVVNSSSVLFTSKRTYVIKSPFPIWVLWAANLMRAGIHALVAIALVLLLALFQGRLGLSGMFWLMVSFAVSTLFVLAVSLLLASLGPFIGDVSEVMRLLMRVLFYASPITYPLEMVPSGIREWMWLNPLTCIVELLRNPIVFNQMPAATVLLGFGVLSLLLFVIACWVFKRVKGVVADVV
jgi:lipopolysaccharide transport system permease protein